jgi:L-ascorbate metabolism protein UlaG (beta-lactamase superfamily)
MKRVLKPVLLSLLLVLALALAWLAYKLQHPPSVEVYSSLNLPAAQPLAEPGSGVRVTFLGVATLLISDGETAILTDGFFTRPDRLSVLAGKIAPEPELIRQSLARAGIGRSATGKLAAVITGHSHYDHALDAPEVARQTGALLVGSLSTANVGRGWGLPEQQLRITHGGEEFDFGRFHVSLVKSVHAPTGFTGGEIDQPLKPPAKALDYKEGDSYSILVRHGSHSLMVQTSAGYVPGALKGRQADVVFLGVGTLGMQKPDYQQAYWQEVVRQVGARRVIPIHWDDFTRPLAAPLQAMPFPFDRFDRSMDFLLAQAGKDKVDVGLAPAWQPIDPFAGLPAP